MHLSYDDWMKAVDEEIGALAGGLSHADLPDICYSDLHEAGMSPRDAANEALVEAGA